ncbi:hypothetical protein [Brevibacillus sp. NRS-1366]|uniref:GAP1-N2 domain-containing protein n=1 Tax=Brevibacillus sp. NRS-1366 TaxID=3233899 RepID=UPI003D19FE42
MSRQPILQQFYTRGRQGIFRSNEGYDTVAKSPGLDNTFIKKTLHPFCVYHAPRELQERAEGDLSLYPEALVCFHTDSGEMVLGRSVFVGADFTGQRNTFFSHNYVIPTERRDEFIKEPSKIFGVRAFARQHDDSMGKELPSLEALPQEPVSLGDRKKWLSQLGVDERIFKQLLYAVMSSLSVKKKVFISLDIEVSGLSSMASGLLEILYSCLPYEMRRHFGFLTYSNEPESKKHIHVMFVEKGSIRSGGGHSDKDFLFDLGLGRIHNVDLQEGVHEYLDFAWEFLNDSRILTSFHSFCEEVLAGADTSITLRLGTYYELCALYLLEKGRMSVYDRNRAGVWQALNSYLAHTGLSRKQRLLDLQSALFRVEAEDLATKKLPEGATIQQMIESYGATKQNSLQMELIRYVMDVLMKAKALRQSGYVAEVYKHLSNNQDLFGFMMRSIVGHKQLAKPLFEDYLGERLAAVTEIGQLLQEIKFWTETAPQALRNPFFITATIEKLLSLFVRERQKLDVAISNHQFFENLDGTRGYAEELLDELDKSLLKQLVLDSLTKEDFQKVVALLEEKPQSFFGTLDLESRQKQELILNLALLLEQKSTPHPAEFFRKWDPDETEAQQRIIQNMLGTPLDKDSFPLVALVFYRDDQFGQEGFHFAEMLSYVQQNGGEAVVHAFVQWTMTQRMFFEGKDMMPAYRQALKQFFLEDKGRRLRNKEWRKRWSAIRNADFRRLLEEVRSETANPFVKLFQSKAFMTSGLIVLVAAGTWGGYMFWGQAPNREGANGQDPSASGTTEHVRVPAATVWIPAYRLMMDPQIEPVVGSAPMNQVSTPDKTAKPATP